MSITAALMSAPLAGGGARSPPGLEGRGGKGRRGGAAGRCRPCGAAAAARVRGNAFDPFPRTFQERGAAAAGAANGRRRPPANGHRRRCPPANGRRRRRCPPANGRRRPPARRMRGAARRGGSAGAATIAHRRSAAAIGGPLLPGSPGGVSAARSSSRGWVTVPGRWVGGAGVSRRPGGGNKGVTTRRVAPGVGHLGIPCEFGFRLCSVSWKRLHHHHFVLHL